MIGRSLRQNERSAVVARFYRLDNCLMIMKAITRSLCKEIQYAEAFDALHDRTPPVLITLKTRNMCICWAKFYVRFQIIMARIEPIITFSPFRELHRKLVIRREPSCIKHVLNTSSARFLRR